MPPSSRPAMIAHKITNRHHLTAQVVVGVLIWLLAACQPLTPARSVRSFPTANPPSELSQRLDRQLHPQGVAVEDLLSRAVTTEWTFDPATAPALQAGQPKSTQIPAFVPATWAEGAGEGPVRRMNYFVAQRIYPKEYLPPGARMAALQSTIALRSRLASTQPQWQNIGPAPIRRLRVGQQVVDVSGRVTALAVDPRNSNVAYLGAALGGLWKTEDGGGSWRPLTDDTASLAVGAIALQPGNPDVIYVGTGEPTPGLDNYYGAGILRSTNGGQSWSLLGADLFNGLAIAAIRINPANPNLIYVAASTAGVPGPFQPVRGIFRSADGGQSWTPALTCQSPCQGAASLVMDAQSSGVLYASFWQHGIFKSTDGGANWAPLGNGLPDVQQIQVGRILVDISPSNPQILYASLHIMTQQVDGALLFKSSNGGNTWSQVALDYNYCTSQCWYSNALAVHPTNPNTVYLGGSAQYLGQTAQDFTVRRVVIRTTDGGTTWSDLTPNDSPAHSLHPDMHVVTFDPQNANTVWVGNDGGVWKSTDGGQNWQNLNTNLATLQFTGIAINPANPAIVQGGMQDNSKAFTSGDLAWTGTDVGDGGFAAVDPFNPTIWYGSRFGKSFQRNDVGPATTGEWPVKMNGVDQQEAALFYPPLAIDPSTQGVLYFGAQRLYRSSDRGESWSAISNPLGGQQGRISTIAVAPSNSARLYAGTSDGRIYTTVDQGGSWQDVTGGPLPNRWLSRLAVDPANPAVAYAAFNGFAVHTPGQPGHIFQTKNSGASWQDISANLPDMPALAILVDPGRAGVLYVGTDMGVFRSGDDGQSWTPFSQGLPNVAVVDLALSGDGATLVAATHGRSVYRVALSNNPIATVHSLFMPAILRGVKANIPPTVTPPATATGIALPTATATATPTRTPTPTMTPTPTRTPSPLPSGQPSLTPTRTPSPTFTPTLTPEPDTQLYRDDFDDPNSGWEVAATSLCNQGYDQGGYAIAVLQLNQICLGMAPIAPQGDGSLHVLAGKNGLADGSVYGLVIGVDDTGAIGRFDVFWVDPANQLFAIQRYSQGGFEFLTLDSGDGDGWIFSPAIALGGNGNLLGLRRQGTELRVYVNDLLLYVVTDTTLPAAGGVGLANWGAYNRATALTWFDQFVVDGFTTVFADGFSDPASGWDEGDIQVCQASYQDDAYRTGAQAGYYCVFRAPGNPQAHGIFSAQVQSGDGLYPVGTGLILAEDGQFGSFYAYIIQPESQLFALLRYDSVNGWQAISRDKTDGDSWIDAPAIHSGSASNQLQAERDHNLIHLWVNGTDLGFYQDPNSPLPGERFGMITLASQLAEATATYDDYQVIAWLRRGSGVESANPGGQIRGQSLSSLLQIIQPE